MLQSLRAWIESKLWKERRKRSRAYSNYDLITARNIEADIDMFQRLLDAEPDYAVLKSWLKCEIVLTEHKEASHKSRDTYTGYRLAEQQADFRAALIRVQSKINRMERTE